MTEPVRTSEKVCDETVSTVTTMVPPSEKELGDSRTTGRVANVPFALSKYGGVMISKFGWF